MKRLVAVGILASMVFTVLAQTVKTSFTGMECEHLRVRTPGLFEEGKGFTLRLDSLPQDAYCFPLPGGKVISKYGSRGGRHSGYDIKTKANDTIRSVFDGVVRLSKPYAAYGNLIVIRHANGLESVYSHQSKNLVKSGDSVHAGQPIGLTGRSGRATTEHLHFEFRIDGQHFNPDLILDMQHRKLHPKTYRVTRTKEGIQLKPENEKQ